MEQLNNGQIHLWLAWLGEITDPRLLAEYRSLLSEEERQRQMRFHFERDRHRYLVTRAMVRTVLSKYADVAPRDWRFVVGDYGRPLIAADDPDASSIEFNVSHTHGLVIMGVTRERAIGVDVENVSAREVDIEVAHKYFAPEEVAAIRALPRAKQKQRFFEYWTLKESYIKARGVGLSISLERFAFHLEDPQNIRLTIDPTLQDCAQRWLFWQIVGGHDHLIALCAAHGGDKRPHLAATRSWP